VSLVGLYFAEQPVTNFDEAKKSDTALYRRFFHAMLRRGVYLAPSPFEAMFISLSHGWDELERTSDAAAAALDDALSAPSRSV
jgi:glutamate-1-semialdehyde 2,1-aminomutase